MKRRFLSMLLALAMALGAMQGLMLTAAADDGYPAGMVIVSLDASGAPAAASGEGWSFAKNSLTLNAGYSFAVDGVCKVTVFNYGTIVGGEYEELVRNSGTIENGTFRGTVSNFNGSVVNGGLFCGKFQNGLGQKDITINEANFALEYVLNGGVWAEGYTAPASYSYTSGAALPGVGDISCGSATFEGWYDNEGLNGTPLTAIAAGGTGTVTLYASFIEGFATWAQVGAQAQEGTDYTLDGNGNYTVYTAAGLAKVAAVVNGGDTLAGRSVTLAGDIDLLTGGVYQYGSASMAARASWMPISGFAGTFDGGGHKIFNLYVSMYNQYAGLFGQNNGTIRNLEIASGRVVLTTASGSELHAGAVAAASTGVIENCVNRAEVSVIGTSDRLVGGSGAVHAGGIVGLITTDDMQKTNIVSTVSGCVNYGAVTGGAPSHTYREVTAGGIAGYFFSGFNGRKTALLTDCVNHGPVAVQEGYPAYAGGIAGVIRGNSAGVTATLANCENRGGVGSAQAAGGITGYMRSGPQSGVYALVHNSYNVGSVYGGERAGGIVGLLTNTASEVVNCYNRGAVSGAASATLGGIAGYATYGTADHSYYEAGTASAPCGATANGAAITDCYEFAAAGEGYTLTAEVYGTSDLLGALRAWVSAKSDALYYDWMADQQENNYPIFARTYQVTYHTDGGVIENEASYTSYLFGVGLTLPTPTKDNFVFEGWFEDSAFTGSAVTQIGAADSGDKVFYAKWAPAGGTIVIPSTYTLTFVTNGGSYVEPIRGAAGSRIALTQVTQRPGYVFVGWCLDAALTQQADSVVLNSDVTVYALWREDTTGPDGTGVSQWLITAEHIKYLQGDPDGTFGPDRDMTRAEAAQIFYNLLLNKNVPATVHFDDVAADAWYAKAVETLATLGMIQGVGDGKFAPERSITRAEFTAMAMRFGKLTTAGENIFRDVAADAWYYGAVAGSVKYGWINGYPDGTFRPDNTITRAEAASIVNRMLGRSGDEGYIRANAERLPRFADLTESHWAYFNIMEAANAHSYTKVSGGESWK